jgi:hypothetical protein
MPISAARYKADEWSDRMAIPLDNLSLFLFSLLIGITMLVEGYLIARFQKQIIPLPAKILYWIGRGTIGKEKSVQKFTGKTTPENLRTYAIFDLGFGFCLTISSLIYLNWMLSQFAGR